MRVLVTIINSAEYPPRSTFRRGGRADWELVWIVRGSAQWRRAGEQVDMTVGDVLLAGPGGPEEFSWDAQLPTWHGYAHFTPDLGPALSAPQGLHWAASGGGLVGALCGYLSELASSDTSRAAERAAAVVSLVAAIMIEGPAPGGAGCSGLPALIDDAARAVGRLWAGRGVSLVSLDEVAWLTGCSRRHLCRLFAGHLRLGPVDTFEHVRLSRVAALLARGGQSVHDAAAACGYASPYHLSRRFHRAYGVSPSAYREQVRSGGQVSDPLARLGLRPLAFLVAEAQNATARAAEAAPYTEIRGAQTRTPKRPAVTGAFGRTGTAEAGR